ncbi:MAG TPA: PQQ-binding-like beta-propeller repeat protein, partial [Thermomicrobiales bacterium]|nr:PQQ-binding-like beta-propeller repeat protein [Thermomicrobiales bacterium]
MPGAPARPDRSETWARWSSLGIVLLIGALLGATLLQASRESHGFVPGVATPAASPAADWPMYRGDPAHTGVASGAGPARSPAVVWRVQTQGQIHSEPAIVDGMVYIGSNDNLLHALDAATGAERWHATTGGALVGGAVVGSPTVPDGTVYVGSADKVLYALDAADGKARWQVAGAIADASPVVVDGVVYTGSSDGRLWALDAATGKLRWQASLGTDAQSTPAVADGVVYLGSADAVLHAIDAATGQERWRAPFDDGTLGTPVIRNGTVYEAAVGGGHNRLAALDASTGKERWRFTTKTGDSVWTPVVTDDTVFAGSNDHNLYALDAATGAERWRFTTGGPVDASPTLADGILYAASRDRTLYALDAATGAERWRLAVDGEADKGPAVAGGMVYLGTFAGSVYAIGGAQPDTAAPAAVPPASPTAAAPVAFLWERKGAGLQEPTDLAIDPQGRLWVTNGGAGQFQIFAADGTFVETWGSPGSGDGQFNFIRENGDAYGGIAFAPDGGFYVLDTGNRRVQQFDANRTFVRAWTGTGAAAFLDPMGMARAPDGAVLVLDDERGEVDRFSPDGAYLGAFSSHPNGKGGLNSANDLTTDAQGNVYISALDPSFADFRVEKLDSSGTSLATIGAGDFPDQSVALAVDAV